MRRLLERLGEPVQIGTATVRGVYVNRYQQAPLGAPGAANSEPVLAVMSSDAQGIALGAALSVAGRNWRVMEKRPDGSGVTELLLQLAP